MTALLERLRSDALPEVAPADSRGLQRVVVDLEDAKAELGDDAPDIDELLQTVRHRAMLDSAIEEAIGVGAPVQTVRLAGPQPSTRLVDAVWRFGERRLIERGAAFEGTIEIVLTDPTRAQWQRTLSGDFSDIAQIARRALPARARLGRRDDVVLDRTDVPQANTVKQVSECVEAMSSNGEVTVDDISGITAKRQVDYYKHGARVLGLFDDDNLPTARARAIAGLPYEEQLGVTAIYFEDPAVGRAWRTWAGKQRLSDVDPNTAEEFLSACARGLSGTTPARRASTLRKWHGELMPRYGNRRKPAQRRSSST